MVERRLIAALYFLVFSGTIVLIASMAEPNRLLDWLGGTLLVWGTLIVQFYFRKKEP